MNENTPLPDYGISVMQQYDVEALISEIPSINSIREYLFLHRENGVPEMKELHRYLASGVTEAPWITTSSEELEKVLKGDTDEVLSALIDRGYLKKTRKKLVFTSKLLSANLQDFRTVFGEDRNKEIFYHLDKFLWKPVPGLGEEGGVAEIIEGRQIAEKSRVAVNKKEWWFLIGNGITTFCFKEEPSEELLELLAIKLHLIQLEKQQKFFHILSSYNGEPSVWFGIEDKREQFFSIMEKFLLYTWRPFDMEECSVSIEAKKGPTDFAVGTLSLVFKTDGQADSQFSPVPVHFDTAKNTPRDFAFNDVLLRTGGETEAVSHLKLRIKSRTYVSVDPRHSMLAHRFVKSFIESLVKIISVVLPVMHREDLEKTLRWRYFLESLRFSAQKTGEDLHKVVTGGLKSLKRFFGIDYFFIFSEDKDFLHMLKFFARKEKDNLLYEVLHDPLTPEVLLQRQLIPFPLFEMNAGRVILYFKLPLKDAPPKNPQDPEEFLMGTELGRDIRARAQTFGVYDLKDFLFFLVTECLSTNPKAILFKITQRWPVIAGRGDNLEALVHLTRQALDRYTPFFDIIQTVASNLESSLSYLRSRRDQLTGLYNRQSFQFILEGYYGRPNCAFGLMFIDMDNFKIFNDAVSHSFGDKLLISLADRLMLAAEIVTAEANPGRFGGDEFCFSVAGIDRKEFEAMAIQVFSIISKNTLDVDFYLDDRIEGMGLEVNLISFLHRLIRPDIGSRQASLTEFVERPDSSPQGYILDIYNYYRRMNKEEEKELTEEDLDSKTTKVLVQELTDIIEKKILWNKIFSSIDDPLHSIISNFVKMQLNDETTDKIREKIISDTEDSVITREINLKVSVGLAHSREHRLRSVASLFKAADGRAYLAKHNGKGCLFGIDGERLT